VQIAAINDLVKKFNFNGYDLHYISPYANRGVGILIRSNLGITINDTKTDRTGNILLLNCSKNGQSFTLGSIYGPNENNREFFADLGKMIAELNNNSIVLGGDWNATWDSSPPESNIDVFFMRAIPSKVRSDLIKSIADRHSLTDPYRFLYPNKRDYTYIPNAQANLNRSRFDFFLISMDLTQNLDDSGIETGKLSTLFDHRAVFLNLGKKITHRDKNRIQDSLLDNDIIKIIVELSVKEFYLNNVDYTATPRYTVNTIRSEIGRIVNKLKIASDLEIDSLRLNVFNRQTEVQIANLITEARDACETIPSLEFFENLPLSSGPDVFFEGLVMAMRNEVISKQTAIIKNKNFKKKC
jgi:exonuclease III